jgi:hypothetical protein
MLTGQSTTDKSQTLTNAIRLLAGLLRQEVLPDNPKFPIFRL